MTAKFNPPPSWPPAAPGWTPPPGWQPDPSWGPLPAGWPLWVEDTPAAAAAASPWPLWCIGGGATVVLGSLLPFISNTTDMGYATFGISSGGRTLSVLFGAAIAALGALARRRHGSATSPPGNPAGATATLAVLSALGVLGYAGFAVAGLAGFQDQSDAGFPVEVTFSPGVGLVLCLLGCVLAGFGAIRMVLAASATHRTSR